MVVNNNNNISGKIQLEEQQKEREKVFFGWNFELVRLFHELVYSLFSQMLSIFI